MFHFQDNFYHFQVSKIQFSEKFFTYKKILVKYFFTFSNFKRYQIISSDLKMKIVYFLLTFLKTGSGSIRLEIFPFKKIRNFSLSIQENTKTQRKIFHFQDNFVENFLLFPLLGGVLREKFFTFKIRKFSEKFSGILTFRFRFWKFFPFKRITRKLREKFFTFKIISISLKIFYFFHFQVSVFSLLG